MTYQIIDPHTNNILWAGNESPRIEVRQNNFNNSCETIVNGSFIITSPVQMRLVNDAPFSNNIGYNPINTYNIPTQQAINSFLQQQQGFSETYNKKQVNPSIMECNVYDVPTCITALTSIRDQLIQKSALPQTETEKANRALWTQAMIRNEASRIAKIKTLIASIDDIVQENDSS